MSQILDFLISLLLIFLLLNTIASSLQEYWSSRIGKNTRATMLFDALLKVFQDRNNRNFTDDLYRHPLIESAKRNDNSLPSYIEAATFSSALTDIFSRENNKATIQYVNGQPVINEKTVSASEAYELLAKSVDQLQTSEVKKLLQSFIVNSPDMPTLKSNIERWYDSYMDRVTGWYKARIKRELFWMSLCVAIFLNADLFRIAATLWKDDNLRNALVNEAVVIVNDSTRQQACKDKVGEDRLLCLKKRSDTLYNKLKLSGLPIGWISELPASETSKLNRDYVNKKGRLAALQYKIEGYWRLVVFNLQTFVSISTIWGWILMAFALKQGAPFWFEALTKLINIRGSGARPTKPTEK